MQDGAAKGFTSNNSRGFLKAALLTSAAFCFIANTGASRPAYAQNTSAQTLSLNIRSQDLGTALTTFADRAGLRLLIPSSLVAGKVSPAIAGSYTKEAALAHLLSGSGLNYRFTGANTVTILGQSDGAALQGGGSDPEGTTVLNTITVSSGVGAAPSDRPYMTPGSSAYISAADIERFGRTTPGDIFKGTPGVIAAGGHNGAKLDVNIRGMQGQSRVKVAIDGTQQSSTTWRGYLGVDERVYVDPDLIGGVDISKGPSGGAAGAGSPGGVVAIRTLNAGDIVEDGKSFGARFRAGTSDNAASPQDAPNWIERTDRPSFFDFDNGSGSAAVAWKQDNFDFVAAAAKRRTGNYFAGKRGDKTHFEFDGRKYPLSFTKPGEEVFNTSEDTFSALTKGTFRWGDDHSLELGYVHYQSKFGESMGSLLFQQEDGYRQVKLSDIKTDTYTARYHWDPESDLFDVRFNLWASRVSGTTRAVAAFPDLTKWKIYPADEPRFSRTNTYGGDLNNTSLFDTEFGAFKVNYGASYLIENMNGDEYCSRPMTTTPCVWLQPSIGERAVGSVFSQGEWKVNDWLTFDAGLRYDTYRLKDKGEEAVPGEDERDGARLNPSIGLTLTPLDGVQLFGRYAEGFRPPTLRETMGSDANAIPNPDLEPETTRSFEAGVNVLKDSVFLPDDKLKLKLAYFHNNHYNYISRTESNAGAGQYMFTFKNLDKVMFSGFEVSGDYDTGMFFTNLALNYYNDYEFCFEGSCGKETVSQDYAVGHVPPKVSVSMTMGMRLLEDRLQFGTRITHAGKRLAPITTSDRQRTPNWIPYTTVDAFASYEFTKHLKLDVQAENLFDRYYVDAMDGWMPSPGRTIRASLTTKF